MDLEGALLHSLSKRRGPWPLWLPGSYVPDYCVGSYCDIRRMMIGPFCIRQVTLSGALQYFLDKDELKLLHDNYDLGYRPIIEKTALQAIKNAAPKFSVTEYRLERGKITKDLSSSVSKALGGTCCPKDQEAYGAEPGCKTYSTCSDSDKGVFCVMK